MAMSCLEDDVLQSKGDFGGGFCEINRSWINRDSWGGNSGRMV